jgi:acyl-CoA thioesterase-1
MRDFSRRAIVAAMAVGLAANRSAYAEPAPPVVTLLGDSIVAGYGLSEDEGIAAALQAELLRLGVTVVVRNAGQPGETSASGRGRAKSAVWKDTSVCVVEYGGNDRRLGHPAWMTHDMLDGIVKELKARRISAILMGLRVPETAEDAIMFNAVFPDLAETNDIPLLADFMAGVTPALRQADGVHPNAEGARLIAAKLAPLVAEALKARP